MDTSTVPSREQLLHALYEAAELEHNLMCTYLYAAFSLRSGEDEGLTSAEAAAVARWRATIVRVAIEEMGHLTAVWNITSALGGSPRFGRGNFPLDPGALPAGVVVKLAPFNDAVLQHFIYLERPEGSAEPDGEGFAPEFVFRRGSARSRLTPMASTTTPSARSTPRSASGSASSSPITVRRRHFVATLRCSCRRPRSNS